MVIVSRLAARNEQAATLDEMCRFVLPAGLALSLLVECWSCGVRPWVSMAPLGIRP